MHSRHLARIDSVFVNHGLPRQVAHAHDVVRLVHASFLDGVHSRVHIASAAVEIRRMHVDYQRFARNVFGKNAGGIGQPVVRVDNIKVERVRQHRCHCLVVSYLLYQVVGIASGEPHTAQIVRADSPIVVFDAVSEVEIFLGRHFSFHALTDVVVAVLFPHNRHAIRPDDSQKRLVLIAPRLGDDKRDMHIGLLRHAARQSVTRRT